MLLKLIISCPNLFIVASRCIPKLSKIEEFTRAEKMDKGHLQQGVDYLIQLFNAKEVNDTIIF